MYPYENWRKMSRREFVQVTSAAAAGTALIGWLPRKAQASGKALEKYAHWGEVLVVRDDTATDGPEINAEVVRTMMAESLKQFTGQPTVAGAWNSLLPNWKEDDVIAIKVNSIMKEGSTHPQVADAIVAGFSQLTGLQGHRYPCLFASHNHLRNVAEQLVGGMLPWRTPCWHCHDHPHTYRQHQGK